MIHPLAQSSIASLKTDVREGPSSTDVVPSNRSGKHTHYWALHARTTERLLAIAALGTIAATEHSSTRIDHIADEILTDAIAAALDWCERDGSVSV